MTSNSAPQSSMMGSLASKSFWNMKMLRERESHHSSLQELPSVQSITSMASTKIDQPPALDQRRSSLKLPDPMIINKHKRRTSLNLPSLRKSSSFDLNYLRSYEKHLLTNQM